MSRFRMMTSWPPCAIFWAATFLLVLANHKDSLHGVPPTIGHNSNQAGVTQRAAWNELELRIATLLSLTFAAPAFKVSYIFHRAAACLAGFFQQFLACSAAARRTRD